MKTSDLLLVKDVLGWVYFTAWSSTFWPQVVLNAKRRCTSGFSHDFQVMSFVGFVAYGTFTCGGYLNSAVKAAYILQRGFPPPIELADVCFAVHALLMSTALMMQVLCYAPGFNARRIVVYGSLAAVMLVFAMVMAAAIPRGISWVTALEFCGLVKVFTSFLKHIPQAVFNYQRKSTVGFSITMVLLDVVGSSCSFAQQGVRCVIEGSFEPFIGNPSKLVLAIESFVFDIFFCYQHFVLYRERVDRDVRYSPLGEQPMKTEL